MAALRRDDLVEYALEILKCKTDSFIVRFFAPIPLLA